MARTEARAFLQMLLCRRFLLDDDFQMRGHVLVQLHWNSELAQGLQRLMQLDLAAIDVEALLGQRVAPSRQK